MLTVRRASSTACDGGGGCGPQPHLLTGTASPVGPEPGALGKPPSTLSLLCAQEVRGRALGRVDGRWSCLLQSPQARRGTPVLCLVSVDQLLCAQGCPGPQATPSCLSGETAMVGFQPRAAGAQGQLALLEGGLMLCCRLDPEGLHPQPVSGARALGYSQL